MGFIGGGMVYIYNIIWIFPFFCNNYTVKSIHKIGFYCLAASVWAPLTRTSKWGLICHIGPWGILTFLNFVVFGCKQRRTDKIRRLRWIRDEYKCFQPKPIKIDKCQDKVSVKVHVKLCYFVPNIYSITWQVVCGMKYMVKLCPWKWPGRFWKMILYILWELC